MVCGRAGSLAVRLAEWNPGLRNGFLAIQGGATPGRRLQRSMRDAILSLDIGTTVVKAVLFDLAGQELAVAEQALGLHRPQPGWAELDPEEMSEALSDTIRDALVSLCKAQGFTYVTLDLEGYRTGSMNEVLEIRPEA